MPDEPSVIDPGNFGGGSGGGVTPPVTATVDASRSANSVRRIFSILRNEISSATAEMTRFERAAERASNAVRRIRGSGGGTNGQPTTSTADATNDAIANQRQSVLAGISSGMSRFGGAMGSIGTSIGNISPNKAMFATTAFQIGQAGVGALDQRVNNAYAGMLANDRLAVLFQQTQGISQQQYYDNYRQPLQQFRLGAGGINTLLALQAQTGLEAGRQAGSIQGLSAASGYAYSTQDFAQMIRTLANPMVNNRMTMTLGTGIYGPGGNQRSLTEVFQQVVRGAGLTNRQVIQSGKQIGSLTRARLSALGIPEDMHDLILQYAEENSQFQRKTGGKQGMYDPEQVTHRRLMGIENNFATQKEETERKAAERDERFYNRQKDNLASLERNTQALISLQAAIEDRLSGVVGARISTRGHPLARLGKAALGIGMMGVGGLMMLNPTAPVMSQLAGASLMSMGSTQLFGTLRGDGTETDSKKKGSGASSPSSKPTKLSNFSNLNNEFRDRLEQLINASGGRVWVGEGFRSAASQDTLFKSRYTRTNEKTNVFWDGSYWKNTSGKPDAAPPGMSMHELGLAADMDGDLNWLQKNAARFGLKTFANVNNEPWHVQPLELPNSRRQYEAAGSPWGTVAGATKFDPNAFFEGSANPGGVSESLGKSYGKTMIPIYSQMSISDSIEMAKTMGSLSISGTAPFGRMTSKNGGGSKSSSNSRKRQTLSGNEIAKILYDAGFRGNDLVKAIAISHRESVGWNVNAFNGNKDTKDQSYGLFQINMLGSVGPWRRKLFGISSDEELFNPVTNAKAAYKLYELSKKEGKDPFHPWGPYRGKDPTFSTDMRFAADVAKNSGYLSMGERGDPTMPTRSSGGMVVASGDTITIAPNIYIQSTGNNEADARRTAQEFVRIFNNNVRLTSLRSS